MRCAGTGSRRPGPSPPGASPQPRLSSALEVEPLPRPVAPSQQETPMKTRALLVAALVLGLLTWSGRAYPQSAPSTKAKGGGRDTAHYTADRPLDFLHMRLELTFSPEGLRSKTCEGRVEYTLKPRAATVRTVRLD